ncbi:MAG: TldD/PmbA family protein [Caulobacteraceae bacterium]|nr:TldD/PmbA family protein [Caulobacteraceae bacterium]
MSDPASALAHELVQAALKAGADAAEAAVAERQSLSVGTRLGELEEVEREESRDLGLRVFIGKRQASVSASDLSEATRTRLVERAVAMARLAPEDPWCGLAPEERLARGAPAALDLFDPTEPSAETLEARARAAEEAARAIKGVTNSEGGSASWSQGRWRLVTSAGFEGEHRGSASSISASVIAGEGSGMERGGEGRTARWIEDLPGPEEIGRLAGERAVRRVGARKIGSRTATVIVENRIAASMLSAFVGAISGAAVARGVSFLKESLGKPVFAPHLTITDDPFRPRGLSSTPFDDEGVQVARRAIVDRGVLTTWLLNSASARQLGLESTGHASRGLAGPPGTSAHNLHVEPGALDLNGLMGAAGEGLLVTAMFGPSLNANTGDWSAGVSGFWFEKGEIAYPVTEITIAGALPEIYQRLVPGSDLEFRGSINAPSLMAEGVAIAGL